MLITEKWLKDNNFQRKGEVKFWLELPIRNHYARFYIEVIKEGEKWIARYIAAGYKSSEAIDNTETVQKLVECLMRNGQKKPEPPPKKPWSMKT